MTSPSWGSDNAGATKRRLAKRKGCCLHTPLLSLSEFNTNQIIRIGQKIVRIGQKIVRIAPYYLRSLLRII